MDFHAWFLELAMLREFQDLFEYHTKSTINFANHDVHNVFEKVKRDMRPYGFDDLRGKRVLDLGCGQRYPFALQCAAEGANVTALDINYIVPEYFPIAFYKTMKCNGIKRAIKTLIRNLLFDGKYFHALEAAANRPLKSYRSSIKFIVANPMDAKYPLPSNSFDLIASNAVLEHVMDLSKYVGEVNRLLESGGYFYGYIHSYYSLSGGHNLQWAYPEDHPSTEVPPWDHLRENRFPTFTYLNRYKPDEYTKPFKESMQILLFEGRDIKHDPGGTEGEQFLTKDLECELSNYPRELLLTRSWCLICRKP